MLTRRRPVWGSVYGVGVCFFMNYVVIPMSATARGPFVWSVFANAILIHICGVGICGPELGRNETAERVGHGRPGVARHSRQGDPGRHLDSRGMRGGHSRDEESRVHRWRRV